MAHVVRGQMFQLCYLTKQNYVEYFPSLTKHTLFIQLKQSTALLRSL